MRCFLICHVSMIFIGFMVSAGWAQPPKSDELNQLTDSELDDGWILLFDGSSLFGWQAESEVDWAVADGAIRATRGSLGLLRTTTQFDHFELKLEFRAAADTNSGIFIQTSPKPTDPTLDCYEINLINPERHRFPTGSLVGRSPAQDPPQLDGTTWHSMEIRCERKSKSVLIDGRMMCHYDDDRPLGKGYIGLQFNSGEVAFRNIKIRPKSLYPLIPDLNREHWNWATLRDSQIETDSNGQVRLSGGPGQLESIPRFSDFWLQGKFRSSWDSNSGVFFRCLPGEFLNGYECQIDHRYLNDDPQQPADCGTGGIFRRQNARQIYSRGDNWFFLTIVANDSHFATWVNGLQTTDWRDSRPQHQNPRKGLRLESGTIGIQGHDPKTSLDIQQLNIREIEARQR